VSQPDHVAPENEPASGETPTRTIVVRLVLLPGLIVLVFVLIWLVIGYLTVTPGDIEGMLDDLQRPGRARFRAAVNLVKALGDPDNTALKSDTAVVARLSTILEEELRRERVDQQQQAIRICLCRALGEFHVADGLPVLIEAASVRNTEADADVRRTALEAIAVLAGNVPPETLTANPRLLPVLLEAAAERSDAVRNAAAFALGVVGGSQAEEKLQTLLSDPNTDVRYNAALGLARQGNPAAVDLLVEMLDPQRPMDSPAEQSPAERDFRRATILTNALRVTERLADSGEHLPRLIEAVEQLSRANVDLAVRARAKEVLLKLRGGR